MTPQTTQLVLPDDLADDQKTGHLTPTDRDALRGVSAWLDDFITKPHEDLGRSGTVCPFVPGSLERRALRFATEDVADLDAPAVVEVMDGYKRLFLSTAPADADDAFYSTIIVVFPDLPAERAEALFGEVLEQLSDEAYEEDGIIFGPFFQGNAGTAIYNDDFRPFQSPTPFIFVRYTVPSDWKFFVDDEALLDRWARRFGTVGTETLAKELRRMPWRSNPA